MKHEEQLVSLSRRRFSYFEYNWALISDQDFTWRHPPKVAGGQFLLAFQRRRLELLFRLLRRKDMFAPSTLKEAD